ncbi:MAG: T9SS type A sorting domain-containing protein [Ignavibacteria bacterium]|nr:T9SS type A sorting domain-containing protein [Ignavibacteria bacterium]
MILLYQINTISYIKTFQIHSIPQQKISFEILKSSNVKLTVYNSLGKKIESLIDNILEEGSYETIFNGIDYSSGIYFYRLEANNFLVSKKMILLK